MFVLSPGSTKRNGVVFISAHPPSSSLSPRTAYHRLCLPLPLPPPLPRFHSTSKSIRLPAKPLLPPPPSKLSLDALSRTAYMATRSSPPRDFDSCLIHVAPSFPPVLVLNFLARLSSTILFAVYSSKLASPSAKQIHDRITTSNNNIFRLTESKKVEGAARDTHGRVKMGACRGHGTYERVRARWVSNM